MKKILSVLGAIFLVAGTTAYLWHISDYEESNYYVRVHRDNSLIDKKEEIDNSDTEVAQYTYVLKVFNIKGESKDLKYTTLSKLPSNCYLKLLLNDKDEVVKCVVQLRNQIPKNALKHLD